MSGEMIPFIFQFCRLRTVSIQYLQVILIQPTVLYIQKETGLSAQTLPPRPFCKKVKFIISEFVHFRLALGRDDVSELTEKNV